MKAKLIMLLAFTLLILSSKANAKGGISILYGDGPEVSLVKELPSGEEYTINLIMVNGIMPTLT